MLLVEVDSETAFGDECRIDCRLIDLHIDCNVDVAADIVGDLAGIDIEIGQDDFASRLPIVDDNVAIADFDAGDFKPGLFTGLLF